MFSSLSRSYRLVQQSWAILKQDKEILIFPVLSGFASLAVAASFLIPLYLFGLHQSSDDHKMRVDAWWYVFTFLFYLVSYFITTFFNVGVMQCASIRMNGGDPTIADGFQGAFSRLPAILAWALVSATVGMVLRVIEERAQLIGRIVASLLGVAWTLLTYFAVPVMIFEGKSVGRSITRSGELFKKTWGEAVVGEAGMGLFFGLLGLIGAVPVAIAVFLASTGSAGVAIAILLVAFAIFYWIALGVVSAALKGIFNVALYRYAATGQIPGGFTEDLVAQHWRPKG